MAESASRAFGRYLRILRERRGLSLLDVSRLSEQCPEKIDKGTLSRLERGQQSPSLYKISPLSRIYEVPPDVLIERMELDREVERQGDLVSAGSSLDELVARGREALLAASRKWEAYACFRDALPLATGETRGAILMNLATAIRSLGKNQLALHELRQLESSGEIVPDRLPVLYDRMSNCYRCLGDLDTAREYAEAAIAEALRLQDLRTLAFAYNSRANVALDGEQYAIAAEFLEKAFRVYRDSDRSDCFLEKSPSFEVNTLLMLADCHIHLRRFDHARKEAIAAKRLSKRHRLQAGRAYSEIVLGIVDDRAGLHERALQRWELAAETAQRLENRRLEFLARFEILRQALANGESRRALGVRRALDRLVPWVPRSLPSLIEYKKIVSGPASDRPGRFKATS